MSEYCTRTEIQKPVKKTHCGYDKKQIDEWFAKGIEKERCGRKAKERKTRMLKADFDVWNLRKNKEPIKYTGLMVDVIKFLQPNLRHKEISNL